MATQKECEFANISRYFDAAHPELADVPPLIKHALINHFFKIYYDDEGKFRIPTDAEREAQLRDIERNRANRTNETMDKEISDAVDAYLE